MYIALYIELLLYNCIIAFPYYLIVVVCEFEFVDIFFYFKDQFSLVFLCVLLLSIVLACFS